MIENNSNVKRFQIAFQISKLLVTTYKYLNIHLQVGNLTSVTQTHCRCTHLTAFGSMMDVTPNPIDFGAVMDSFGSMFKTGNVTVLFFTLAMFLIYSLVLIWARRADKRDIKQVILSLNLKQL